MSQVRDGRLAPTVWVALAALLLALAAGSWLAFSPGFYQGVSVTASSSGEVVQRSEQASLLAENGMWVLGLLAVPVALTGLGVFGAARRFRFLLWSVAVVPFVASSKPSLRAVLFREPALRREDTGGGPRAAAGPGRQSSGAIRSTVGK